MSYCRFSSDNWRSDVYVYEDVAGGWTTHVASARVLGEIPPEPGWEVLLTDATRWQREHQVVMDFLETCERAPIGLPHDGETFNDRTPGACRDRLLELRKLGYHVPQYAVDDLTAEEADPLMNNPEVKAR